MWQKQNLYPRKRYQLILNDFPLYYTKCVDILLYQDVPFHPLHGHALHGARRTGDDDDNDGDGLLGGGFSGLMVLWTLARAVRVQALAGVIVLCVWQDNLLSHCLSPPRMYM